LHLGRGKTGEVEETNDIEAGKDPEGVSPPEDGGNQMFQTCWLPHIAELVKARLIAWPKDFESNSLLGVSLATLERLSFDLEETIFYTSQLVNAETTRGIRNPVAANKVKQENEEMRKIVAKIFFRKCITGLPDMCPAELRSPKIVPE